MLLDISSYSATVTYSTGARADLTWDPASGGPNLTVTFTTPQGVTPTTIVLPTSVLPAILDIVGLAVDAAMVKAEEVHSCTPPRRVAR
ncbi:MAG TPA: hypothetical protein VGR62_20580 [Candidatus Binatia bacterium]|jgi:hypothetical protein|nr:hypothetical protein [Candidatus Binatia bacterium]